ncbi:MAG: hypothetical protein ACKPE6_02210, partial [Gammaproteobacteria bacterium]
MNRHASALGFVLLSIAIAACSRSPEPAAPSAPAPVDPVAAAAAAISASALERNIRELSSDAFGGRKPDTPGEQFTIKLLEREFRGLGLQPANGGSFVQEVPLVELEAGPEVRLGFSAGGSARPTDLPYRERQVIYSRRMDTAISVKDAGVVFVGYGVNAPERGWNDYAGVDVRGKVVLMLINDPGFHANDPALFNGRAMTYYGRWDYKFDEAARQGAIGALIIHDNEGATYPWRTVQNSWTGPTFHLPREDRGAALRAFQGWVANEAAREMLAAAGAGLDDLMREVGASGFRARTLPLRLSAGFANRVHEIRSRNVAAV